MVGYWFYKFNVEDRDIGTVDYTSFKDSSRISYPVASLCFESLDPFSREKIEQLDPSLDVRDYISYLKGDEYEEVPYNVDYSSITLDLDDYLNSYAATLRNGTYLSGSEIGTFSHKANFDGLSEWGWFLKCFELTWEIPEPGIIKESWVAYNKTKLLRDAWNNSLLSLELYIHYPGQFLLAPNDPTYPKIYSNRQSLEVMKL